MHKKISLKEYRLFICNKVTRCSPCRDSLIGKVAALSMKRIGLEHQSVWLYTHIFITVPFLKKKKGKSMQQKSCLPLTLTKIIKTVDSYKYSLLENQLSKISFPCTEVSLWKLTSKGSNPSTIVHFFPFKIILIIL